MTDEFEFTLHSPLTEEDWNKLSDVEHENTISVTFQTPQGRQVRYIKCEVLDRIRAEIEAIIGERNLDDYDFCSGLICARKIIDKYKVESEGVEK